jgi:hypothetical protein
LIEKYAINAETNTTFARIIKMFDGQPNYQLWGVKVVFSKAIKVEELESIKNWAEVNPSLIKQLSKNGNIICYSTASDFATLRKEMDGLCKIAFVKGVISRFNTDQRKILTEEIAPDSFNGLTCDSSGKFKEWFTLFDKFNKLSANTKTKVIGRMSAVRNVSEIKTLINQALQEKYAWNKEDLLSFVANNTPDCDVVFNDKDIVVLNVKSYKDSNTLCYGRTSWCITSSEGQWKNYVSGKSNKQYFFFDFSKPEKDELAHIGFTVNDTNGFHAAHSTSDGNMMNMGINYHGKNVNIQQALVNAGVGLGMFLRLKANNNFKWNAEDLIKFAKKHDNDMAIAYNKDNRIIINALTQNGLSMLCGHTFIKVNNMPIDNNAKCYVVFDFNLTNNDDKGIISVYYKKDTYKIDTLNQVWDAYGTNIKDDKYLAKIGIRTEDYLNREAVNPSILLHKLIDEGDEEGAIKLIDENKDVDVNFVFNDKRPIFTAIDSKMHRIVAKIIVNDKFDSNVDDGFGESLIQNLLWSYYLDETNKVSSKNAASIRDMVETIVDSGKFDLNYIDGNEDTTINIACTNPNMLWLVEKLAAKKDINVNCVNDIGWAALGNAIRYKNTKAIEFLGKRPDLEVRDKDKELAKKMGIDLDKFIKPVPFNEATETKVSGEVVTAEVSDADKYNEIFKKVFAG